MRRITRKLVTVASLAAILMIATVAYGGGGEVWEFEGYHHPGDIVESTTAVTWHYDANPGTPEDGPYLLYIAPLDVDGRAWGQPPAGSLPVGIVEVHEGPFIDDDGGSYGPHHAIARFEIPELPTGRYQIFHCNDPCTTTLGNIQGGWDLRVIDGPDGRLAEDVAADIQARVATAPLLIAAEPSRQGTAVEESPTTTTMAELAVVEPVRVSDRSQVSAGGPEVDHPGESTTEQHAQFDSLWVLTVGVVALLLVIHIVRTQSQWWRPVEKSGNAPASTDVLNDK